MIPINKDNVVIEAYVKTCNLYIEVKIQPIVYKIGFN